MRLFEHYRSLGATGLMLAAWLSAASPVLAHETRTEAANKKVVIDFYNALNAADADGATKVRIKGIAETYLAPDYIQRSERFANLPGPGSARDKLIRMFQSMPAIKLPPSKTLSVMAEGDLVMMLTVRDFPDPATGQKKSTYIFNMFRVRNGMLVEHWDISPQPPGPPPPGMPGLVPPPPSDR
jgi:predicted SnoaL-like aldol condensation-catalyzing enzyme